MAHIPHAQTCASSWGLWDGNWVPLGNSEAAVANVNLYPNPAKDIVTISGLNGISNVMIYDALGRMVMNTSINTNTVDVSELVAGYYNVVIENAENRITKSLTVVK